jgi:hypothetical protein
MAQQFLTSINLNSNELQNALLHPLATAPVVGAAGKVYYNTSENTLYISDGTSWRSVSGDITSVVAGNGLTGGGDSGEVTINVGGGDAIGISSDSIAVLYGPGLRINPSNQLEVRVDDESIELDPTNQLSLKNTAVTAGSYGSATEIPTFTVDADGRLTAAGSATISTSFDIAGDTGSDTVNTGETITFTGGTNITTTVTNNEVTIDLDDSVNLAGDLVVGGNLTVSGTVTTVNTETINLADNIITLNSNASSTPTEDAGIEVERGDSDNVSLYWDEAADRWKLTYLVGPGILTTSVIPVEGEYNNYTFFVNGDTGSHPVANGDVLAIVGGDGIDTAATTATGVDTVTVSHADTSSVSSSLMLSGLEIINEIQFDQFGHVTEAVSGDITSSVDARITAREYKTSIGDGAATTYTVTHNLNTRDILVQLYDNSSYDTVFADVVRATVNTVEVSFGAAPALNDIRVLITKIG